jgi:hypothetical protein
MIKDSSLRSASRIGCAVDSAARRMSRSALRAPLSSPEVPARTCRITRVEPDRAPARSPKHHDAAGFGAHHYVSRRQGELRHSSCTPLVRRAFIRHGRRSNETIATRSVRGCTRGVRAVGAGLQLHGRHRFHRLELTLAAGRPAASGPHQPTFLFALPAQGRVDSRARQ